VAVPQADHCGVSVERRCGVASAAVFLARPADEGVPVAVRLGSGTQRGTLMTAIARLAVSQAHH